MYFYLHRNLYWRDLANTSVSLVLRDSVSIYGYFGLCKKLRCRRQSLCNIATLHFNDNRFGLTEYIYTRTERVSISVPSLLHTYPNFPLFCPLTLLFHLSHLSLLTLSHLHKFCGVEWEDIMNNKSGGLLKKAAMVHFRIPWQWGQPGETLGYSGHPMRR
jgi:hypothetical protein